MSAKSARAAEPVATFALVIGTNRGADAELPPLRYADDDAARYLDLFRLLGTRTYLLTRIDANTQRLHAQAAAEASLPVRADLERALEQLSAGVRQAKQRGIRPVFYFVYAGHGNVRGNEAYILLEDDRLTGKRLAELVARVGADQAHLIIDACYSGLLAQSRGAGGRRRPLSGFSPVGPLMADPRIGLLLSTSSARESHEWEGFQAGVFSHEVRSGLYGAADASGDGIISYREIAAFVERANAAIPNERFRPDVHARAPAGSEHLIDMSRALKRRVNVRTKKGAHYVLENSLGVRLADFHPGPDHEMFIARPGPHRLYIRELPSARTKNGAAEALVGAEPEREFAIPTADDIVSLAELDAASPRVAMRGAAHESFSLIFSPPFDQGVVQRYRFRPLVMWDDHHEEPAPRADWRRPAATVAFGLGVAATAAGLTLALSAYKLHTEPDAGQSQLRIAERNDRVNARRLASYVSFGVAGAASAAGVAFLLWPDGRAEARLSASVTPSGFALTFGSRFDVSAP